MMNFRISPTSLNILMITLFAFILQMILGEGINRLGALHNYTSEYYLPTQHITYMFLHSGFRHFLYNMLPIIFLGRLLDDYLGAKKYMIIYAVTGLGAGFLYSIIHYYQISPFLASIDQVLAEPLVENLSYVLNSFSGNLKSENTMYLLSYMEEYIYTTNDVTVSEPFLIKLGELRYAIANSSMLGASGATFGVITAAALFFPNSEIQLLFIPIPIKIKWIAIVMGVFEFFAVSNPTPGDNVAHYAHLSGMLFAFLLYLYWKTDKKSFY